MKHWADIQNLKIAASSYSAGGSIAVLEQQIAMKKEIEKAARSSLIEIEKKASVIDRNHQICWTIYVS